MWISNILLHFFSNFICIISSIFYLARNRICASQVALRNKTDSTSSQFVKSNGGKICLNSKIYFRITLSFLSKLPKLFLKFFFFGIQFCHAFFMSHGC
jgi:hypothetical protein